MCPDTKTAFDKQLFVGNREGIPFLTGEIPFGVIRRNDPNRPFLGIRCIRIPAECAYVPNKSAVTLKCLVKSYIKMNQSI